MRLSRGRVQRVGGPRGLAMVAGVVLTIGPRRDGERRGARPGRRGVPSGAAPGRRGDRGPPHMGARRRPDDHGVCPTRRRRHTAARPRTARRARRFVLARWRARVLERTARARARRRQWRSTASTHPVPETGTRCGGANRSACSVRPSTRGAMTPLCISWTRRPRRPSSTPPAATRASCGSLCRRPSAPTHTRSPSAARVRLVPPETVAPNGPAQVAPFARPTPTQTRLRRRSRRRGRDRARARAGVSMTPSSPLHACTTATRAQLPAARVLCDSLRRHHPDAEITLLVVDDVDGAEREPPGVRLVITGSDRRAGRCPLPPRDRVHCDRARRRARASPRAGADRGRCPRGGGVRSRHRGLRPTARPRRPRRRTRDRPGLPAR